MFRLSTVVVLAVALLLLQGHPGWAGRGSSYKKPSTSSKSTSSSSKSTSSSSSSKGTSSSHKPVQGTGKKPSTYPKQPQNPNQYHPSGGYPNQNPGGGGVNPGRNPNLYPPAGGYPAAGGYPNHNPGIGGGYPNQYPATGGYPNQYPGRGGVNPAGYPNQYPAAGGYPNQYPGRGGVNPAGYPNQYPAAGGYPAGGGGYPNNRILSPHYRGSYGFGGGRYGAGDSFLFKKHKYKDYSPSMKSKGFGKKAAMAAAGGAVAGMAVGYGLGSISGPSFGFHSPQEQYYYNRYMDHHYGTQAVDGSSRSNPSSRSDGYSGTKRKPHKTTHSSADSTRGERTRNPNYIVPPKSYNEYMDDCMKRTDLLGEKTNSSSWAATLPPHTNSLKTENKTDSWRAHPSTDADFGILGNPVQVNNSINITADQGSTVSRTERPFSLASEAGSLNDKDKDDTVSIVEIGYPDLMEQLKVRRCVELFMAYLYHQEMLIASNDDQPHGTGVPQRPLCQTLVLFLFTVLLTAGSTFLLQ